MKVLHGRTINVHHGTSRQAALRGEPCKVRRYTLPKDKKEATRAWKLLNSPKAKAMSETRALALLAPFSYEESDSRRCGQSVLVLHVQ